MNSLIISKYPGIFIIAEAGVNHNGSLCMAKKLVDAALRCQASAVKFQTFKPGECTGKFAFKVRYQRKGMDNWGSRFQMSKKLALSYSDFKKLHAYCRKQGILFLSTPDGYDSLDFLVNELNVPLLKISSTEVTHLEFLDAIAKKQRPIILSTGMSNLSEVKAAVNIIRGNNSQELTLLHCTSEYPAPYNEVNLRAMVTLRDKFKAQVGYSDHTIGKLAAIVAVALGAKVIEKHFTLNKALPGPDHRASLNPDELKDFVSSIRISESMLGDGIKKPTPSEIRNMPGVRRGIVAAYPLKKGTKLEKYMLMFKRPNTGITPDKKALVIGRFLKKDMEEDEVLQWKFLK